MSDYPVIKVPPQRIRHQRAEAPRRRSLYAAYGSNLSFAHMARRCPPAEPCGTLYLRHVQLLFRGVADVRVERGAEVPLGLWWITPECERSLDSYEGVASRVYMKRYLTVEVDGEYEDVLFYQMRTHRGVMPPSEQYLDTIARGYQDFGLDLAYLDAALSRSWTCKDITQNLHERYVRRGRPKLALPGPPEFTLSEADLREAGAT